MNVQFSNKLSQMAFCHAMSNPAHFPQLQSWLMRFFQGGWRTLAGNIPITAQGNPDFQNWTGHSVRLTIHASTNNTKIVDDLPVTNEFDWRVDLIEIDRYGEDGPTTFDRENLIMNGGLINHGTWEDPDWSSHT